MLHQSRSHDIYSKNECLEHETEQEFSVYSSHDQYHTSIGRELASRDIVILIFLSKVQVEVIKHIGHRFHRAV